MLKTFVFRRNLGFLMMRVSMTRSGFAQRSRKEYLHIYYFFLANDFIDLITIHMTKLIGRYVSYVISL